MPVGHTSTLMTSWASWWDPVDPLDQAPLPYLSDETALRIQTRVVMMYLPVVEHPLNLSDHSDVRSGPLLDTLWSGCCDPTRGHTPSNQAPRMPSLRGLLGYLCPVRLARTARRRQRHVPLCSAYRNSTLDPAACHPRLADFDEIADSMAVVYVDVDPSYVLEFPAAGAVLVGLLLARTRLARGRVRLISCRFLTARISASAGRCRGARLGRSIHGGPSWSRDAMQDKGGQRRLPFRLGRIAH